MHILYVCNEYPPAVAGGIGPAVATLARGMVKAGHRVSVIGFYAQASVENDAGVIIHRVVSRGGARYLRHLLVRRQLRSLIGEISSKNPIDVVEWPDFQGWFLKPLPGITDVVKVHGTQMSHRLHGIGKRLISTEFFE